MKKIIKKYLPVISLSLLLPFFAAKAELSRPAVISLIIDDVGNNPDSGQAVLELPGNLVVSFLPDTPYATLFAELAHEKGKQVMIHIPMEAEHHKNLGPDGLMLNMPETDYKATVYQALQSVPHAVGINNHMGSLLTQHQQPMEWLMDILLEQKMFFLDSRTTHKTVAQQTARIMGVKTFSRDVFLDNSRKQEDIQDQFEQLIKLAKKRGYATGIAHPYPETISVLKQQLPKLQSRGVELVFASDLLERHINNITRLSKRSEPWPESSYPSHKVAKNWKP